MRSFDLIPLTPFSPGEKGERIFEKADFFMVIRLSQGGRMKPKILVAATAMVALSISFCSRDIPVMQQEPPDVVYPGAGKFSLSRTQNLAKTSGTASSDADGRTGFDLGSVKGSASFYFLLYNVGFSPITDISIAFADSHFSAYPERMDTLFPGIDIGLLPVLKVQAAHGTALNGVGSRPLLPMGSDTAVLTIKGSTRTQAGKDSTLTLAARMSVRALVADIEVRDDGKALPLGNPAGHVQGDFPDGIGAMPFYAVSGCTVTVKNTGNVPLALKAWSQQVDSGDTVFKAAFSSTVNVGDSAAVARTGGRQVLCVDGNNTIADPSKLPLAANGKYYFCLRGMTPCEPARDTSVQLNPFITLFYSVTTTCSNVKCRFFRIDNAFVFWELVGREACRYVAAGGRIYRLYGKTPDDILGSYQGEDFSYWTIEHYESKAAHGMLDTIRANLSAGDLGLGKNHTVELIIQ
jgi:hypothetical protein